MEFPDSKVRGADMGPILGRQDPGGTHVGHMIFPRSEYLGKITAEYDPHPNRQIQGIDTVVIVFESYLILFKM